jgi:hypothetical protein
MKSTKPYPQQRGPIVFHPHSIMSEPGNQRPVSSKEYSRSAITGTIYRRSYKSHSNKAQMRAQKRQRIAQRNFALPK